MSTEDFLGDLFGLSEFNSAGMEYLDEALSDGPLAEAIQTSIDSRPQLMVGEVTLAEQAVIKSGQYSVLTAYVGDDAASCGNSREWMPASIAVAEVILRIKISESDVGNSTEVINYAEAWVLLPPGAQGTLSVIQNHIGSKGVATTLDCVDTKYLSYITKGNEEKADLASKYGFLAKAAEWVDKDWITYDQHQLAKVLSLAMFDFRSAREFPYLYKAEGGCGGTPPWHQTVTVEHSLFWFAGGKTYDALLGVMNESKEIRLGNMSPSESRFLPLVHYAQDKRLWTNIYKRLRKRESDGLTRAETRAEINSLLMKRVIPDSLYDKGIEISPSRMTVGMLIGRMRTFDLIQTELDVQLLMESEELQIHLTGEAPLGPILQEQVEAKRLARSLGFSLLVELEEVINPEAPEELRDKLALLRIDPLAVINRYYADHPGALLSSFVYTDHVRVFNADDVDVHFFRGERELFLSSLSISGAATGFVPSVAAYQPKGKSALAQYEQAIAYIRDYAFEDLASSTAFLPQVGVGDPIVLQQCLAMVSQYSADTRGKIPVVLIIVTGDNNCAWLASQYVEKNTAARCLKVTPEAFLNWFRAKPETVTDPTHLATRAHAFWDGKARMLSPGDLKRIATTTQLDAARKFSVGFVFDEANVMRRLAPIRQRFLDKRLFQDRGGFFPRSFVRSTEPGPLLQQMSSAQIVQESAGYKTPWRERSKVTLQTFLPYTQNIFS